MKKKENQKKMNKTIYNPYGDVSTPTTTTVGDSPPETLRLFTIVRDPYERIVSAYKHYIKTNSYKYSKMNRSNPQFMNKQLRKMLT